MVSVSIIIVTYNSEQEIENCFNSLLHQLENLKAQIIIIDNDSTDNTVSIIEKYNYSNISIIQNRINVGYTKANNQGISKANGKFLLLLNPDTEISKGSIQRLILEYQNNEAIGAIAPQLRFPNGEIQYSCRRFPRRRDIIYESLGLGKLFADSKEFNHWKMGDFNHNTSRFVDQPAGAALLIPAKIFNEVGLLDEQFPMFFSDVDICKRICESGYKIQFLHDVYFTHIGGTSIFRNRSKMIATAHISFWKYYQKYKNTPIDSILNSIIGILLVILIPIRIIIKLLLPNIVRKRNTL